MTIDERDDVTVLLRTALQGRLTRPTADARRRSWRAFQAALDRYLAKRGVTQVQPRN
jgi:hypothetical protein